jgi:hypothetical protein
MKLHRSHKRPLEYTIGSADRDPLFKPVWYDTALPGVADAKPAQLNPYQTHTPGPKWDLAPLPPLSQPQQNDHVLKYWDWRLDRLEAKRNGR